MRARVWAEGGVLVSASGITAVLVLLCAVVGTGLSQAPPTLLQALQQHHVGTTRPAFIEALHHPDQEVRGLAAAELAEEKVASALPMILRAAEEEKDPQTRLNLAKAATWMGSADGAEMLKDICGDRNLSSWVRLNAARDLFDRQDHSFAPVEMTSKRVCRVEGLRVVGLVLPLLESIYPDEVSVLWFCPGSSGGFA